MRKLVSTVIALAGSWFVVAADAAPTPSPTPAPTPMPRPTASSLSMGKVALREGAPIAAEGWTYFMPSPDIPPAGQWSKSFSTPYTGASDLYFGVQIFNSSPKPVLATLRVTSGERFVARTSVNVPAANGDRIARTEAFFKDGVPLNPCGEVTYRVELEGTTNVKTVRTKGDGCTFKVTTVDPSSSLPPDTRAAQRANKVYAGGQSVSFAGRCLVPFTVNATVKNGTSTNVVGAKLKLDGPGGADGLGPAFSLAPGASTNATVSLPSFKVGLGDYKMTIQSSAPTYETGWYAKIGIDKCTLATEWMN